MTLKLKIPRLFEATKNPCSHFPGGLIDVVSCYPKVEYMEDGRKKADVTNKYFLMKFDEKLDQSEMEHLKLERKWRQWVDDDFVHKLR